MKQENIMAKCHFSNYTAGQALQKKNSYKQQKKKPKKKPKKNTQATNNVQAFIREKSLKGIVGLVPGLLITLVFPQLDSVGLPLAIIAQLWHSNCVSQTWSSLGFW